MSNEVYQIYDKIFKKILTLSSMSVINLINGLFHTKYPSDSTITYDWTEFESEELKRILADTILTINGKYSYHMEAQMTEDEDIIFRVFEYGYGHADRNRRYAIDLITDEEGHIDSGTIESGCELLFPEPKIIYFCPSGKAPDEYILKLNFGSQGSFLYKVSTFKFLEISLEELNQRKMIILIPFQLLRLRKLLEKERSEENLDALKRLITDDIIGSIEKNLSLGNITEGDARRLRRLTHRLYQHIYAHYNEMEVLNVITDESLMLDIDIIEKKHEEELAKKDSTIAEKEEALAKKDNTIAEKEEALVRKDNTIAQKEKDLARKEQELAKKDAEIADLKAEIERLKNR